MAVSKRMNLDCDTNVNYTLPHKKVFKLSSLYIFPLDQLTWQKPSSGFFTLPFLCHENLHAFPRVFTVHINQLPVIHCNLQL